MPNSRDCAACLRSISRTPGNSELCTRWLRLFHRECLNPCSSNINKVCVTCESTPPIFSLAAAPTDSFSSRPDSPDKAVACLEAPVGTIGQIALDLEPSSGNRIPSSPPGCSSPPSKLFHPPTSTLPFHLDMSTDGPQVPVGTSDCAIPLFHQMHGLRKDVASLSTSVDGLVGRIRTVEQDVSYLSEKTNMMQLANAYRDTCEIRVSVSC